MSIIFSPPARRASGDSKSVCHSVCLWCTFFLRQVQLHSECSSLIGAVVTLASHWSKICLNSSSAGAWWRGVNNQKVNIAGLCLWCVSLPLPHLPARRWNSCAAEFFLLLGTPARWVCLCLQRTSRLSSSEAVKNMCGIQASLWHIHPANMKIQNYSRHWAICGLIINLQAINFTEFNYVGFINSPWNVDFPTIVACSYNSQ